MGKFLRNTLDGFLIFRLVLSKFLDVHQRSYFVVKLSEVQAGLQNQRWLALITIRHKILDVMYKAKTSLSNMTTDFVFIFKHGSFEWTDLFIISDVTVELHVIALINYFWLNWQIITNVLILKTQLIWQFTFCEFQIAVKNHE